MLNVVNNGAHHSNFLLLFVFMEIVVSLSHMLKFYIGFLFLADKENFVSYGPIITRFIGNTSFYWSKYLNLSIFIDNKASC